MRFPRISSRQPAYQDDEIIRSYETHPRYLAEKKSLSEAYWRQLRNGHGWFGSHRRYLGYRRSADIQAVLACLMFIGVLAFGIGALYFLMLTPVFVWFITDLFLLPGLTRAANLKLLQQIAHEEGGLPYHEPAVVDLSADPKGASETALQ